MRQELETVSARLPELEAQLTALEGNDPLTNRLLGRSPLVGHTPAAASGQDQLSAGGGAEESDRGASDVGSAIGADHNEVMLLSEGLVDAKLAVEKLERLLAVEQATARELRDREAAHQSEVHALEERIQTLQHEVKVREHTHTRTRTHPPPSFTGFVWSWVLDVRRRHPCIANASTAPCQMQRWSLTPPTRGERQVLGKQRCWRRV